MPSPTADRLSQFLDEDDARVSRYWLTESELERGLRFTDHHPPDAYRELRDKAIGQARGNAGSPHANHPADILSQLEQWRMKDTPPIIDHWIKASVGAMEAALPDDLLETGALDAQYLVWSEYTVRARDMTVVQDRLDKLDRMLQEGDVDCKINEKSRSQVLSFLKANPDIRNPGIVVDDENGSLALSWSLMPRGTFAADFHGGNSVEFAAVIPNASGSRRQWINGYVDDGDLFVGIFRLIDE